MPTVRKPSRLYAGFILSSLLFFLGSSTKAAEAFWLDQYSALGFSLTLQLDNQLKQMQRAGAKYVLLHSDILPETFLRWFSWRARSSSKLKTVAWIQKPNKQNLARIAAIDGLFALQVDDHFFANPPIPLADIRSTLGNAELWCSFQPRQYNWQTASLCDQVDVQLYRLSCDEVMNKAYALGLIGRSRHALAVYDDGSQATKKESNCVKEHLAKTGNSTFVFKWANPEALITHYSSKITSLFRRR